MQIEWTDKRHDLQGSRWRVWEEQYAEKLQGVLSWGAFKEGTLKENLHLNEQTSWTFVRGVEYHMPHLIASNGAIQDTLPTPSLTASDRSLDEEALVPPDALGRLPERHALLENCRYIGLDLGADRQAAIDPELRVAATRDLQRHLRALGYLRAGIDGIFGNGTEQAIKALQYDLLHNEDDRAPVRIADYNQGRVRQVTGIIDRGTAACIQDLLSETRYALLPLSDDSAQANAQIPGLIAGIPDLAVPLPFLIAVLEQESNLQHFRVPRKRDEDAYLVVGLDRNDSKAPERITSRGYGAGQYTLFYHPPHARDVVDFMLKVDGNVKKALRTLREKFENFVKGPTLKTRSDDRIAEQGDGPLRPCKYESDDPRYMRDCANCMRTAGSTDIVSGETTWHTRTGRLYKPTQYHRHDRLDAVPLRAEVGCDWPYAVRRYNGAGVNSYWYQAELLQRVAGSEIELEQPQVADMKIETVEAASSPTTAPADRTLSQGAKGQAVIEVQLALAGFEGTVWDGDFGPGTRRQVQAFQRDFMGQSDPSGEVDTDTRTRLCQFLTEFSIERAPITCPCKKCDGFGQGQGLDTYRAHPKAERFYQYEYPGLHLAIVQTFRAAQFYAALAFHHEELQVEATETFYPTSGYRCSVRNEQKKRTSTNHMGKALDGDLVLPTGSDKRDDVDQCNRFRDLLVEKGGFQIGWTTRNVKALEPAHIAPSWIHMDVRCYERKYLDDQFFIKHPEEVQACFPMLFG